MVDCAAMRALLFSACAWLLAAAACSEPAKRSEDTEPSPSSSASGSSAAVSASASAEPTPGQERWPILEIAGGEIRLDGAVIMKGANEPEPRMHRIEEVFAALKARREAFKTANPNKEFAGVVGIRVADDVTTVLFKSVFQTAAFAGYPYVSFQRAGDPSIIDLDAQIPGPPDPTMPPSRPTGSLDVQVSPDGVLANWRTGSVIVAERKLGRDPDALKVAACDLWRAHGEHKDKTDKVRDRAIVRVDNKLGLQELRPYFDAVRACTRDAEEGPVPAFDLTFSIK